MAYLEDGELAGPSTEACRHAVMIRDLQEPPPGTSLLVDTLKKTGVPASLVAEARFVGAGSLWLLVGNK